MRSTRLWGARLRRSLLYYPARRRAIVVAAGRTLPGVSGRHEHFCERFVMTPAALRALLSRDVNSTPPTHRSHMRRFLRDESGIAVTEYGLLIALIAVLLIGVVTIFGSSIASWFSAKTSGITSV
jgi:pilus assembly protein Flp/PilA